ncbi:vWA domain-containing protein [Mariniblastus fucicola]|uniref:VWFA domain-containing protein n=1 Tax=Mariniblastus fucicola TaxID=980251 RepID=A0A5B9PGH3_9BACT|nr:vWA domain-containing protein [Mariniblastus fucicola]QEG23696.1 hypothetical protein MFFC18_35970 [Mariniblastus fucicola]
MLNSIKRWWQIKTGRYETPLDTDVPFWMISLVFHLGLILLLAKVLVPEAATRIIGAINADTEEVIEMDELIPEELDIFETEIEELGAESEDELNAEAAATPMLEFVSDETTAVESPDFETGEIFAAEYTSEVSSTAPALEAVSVRGVAGRSLKHTSGAIDRIAEVIRDRMAEGDLMVVWMFDQSASLRAQRKQIAKQFDRVYQQLARFQELDQSVVQDRDFNPPLLTDIYQFGQTVSPLLPDPTWELEKLRKAVASVQRDDSGKENVMQSVMTVAKKYRSMARVVPRTGKPERNVMVILVTDEAGDDVHLTDQAVRYCVNARVSVYSIGVPAPFGREETEVKWVDPDPEYDQTPQTAIVDQGAETPRPERLRLGFVNGGEDLEQIDSGFGPFYLTRLCYETGGLYFAVHPNRTGTRRVRWGEVRNYASKLTYFFDPEIMRRYQPSYVSVQTYNRTLVENRARMALVQAAEFTRTGQPLRSPRLRFPRLDEGTFVRSVSEAQQDAAFVSPALDNLMRTLKAGEVDREKEEEARWQAGYDLAVGRAIAAKLRASTYNEMLALVKTSLKFDPPKDDKTPQNNTWVLRPSNKVETGSRDAQLAEKAKMYLTRVVKDHPGTPWALIAEKELRVPIGWEWRQAYTEPPKPREPGMNNGNNDRGFERRPMMNRDPKERRPVPRL